MGKKERAERAELIKDLARKQHEKEGEIEIDDNAKIAETGPDGDNGAYVAAWVWVSFADTSIDKEDAV